MIYGIRRVKLISFGSGAETLVEMRAVEAHCLLFKAQRDRVKAAYTAMGLIRALHLTVFAAG